MMLIIRASPLSSDTPIVLTIRTTLLSSHRDIVALPHYDVNDGRFAKFCHTPLNHRFHSFIKCLLSERHLETLTVKLSHSAIMTQMMSDLQNSVTRPLIIVFIHLFSAYHQSDTWELLV